MPKVRVNDIDMYYEIHGKGTPLVHIGGLPVTRGPGCVKSNIFLNTSKFSASTIAALDVLIVRTGPIRPSSSPTTLSA